MSSPSEHTTSHNTLSKGSMIPLSDEQLLMALRELSERWNKSVFPIYIESTSQVGAESIGTGFVAGIGGDLCLITALHVVTEINKGRNQVANINGKGVSLAGLACRKSSAQDIAVIPLPVDWQQRNFAESVFGVEIGRPDEAWEGTGVYLGVGYPASKNVIEPRYGKVDRFCFSISMGASSIEKTRVKTKIEQALILEYDSKTVRDSEGKRANTPPKLQGMSGGPCFEVLRHRGSAQTRLSLSAVGVLVEWHRNQKAVLAARLDYVFPGLF